MKSQLNILIAFDGSQQAMDMVRHVSNVFPAARTNVHLFHVAAEVPESFLDLRSEPGFRQTVLSVSAWSRTIKNNMEDNFAEATAILQRAGFPGSAVQATYHKRKVGIARDIIAESHKDYDMLMIGRTGVSQLKDVVVGSVAHKILNAINHLPVAVIGGCPTADRILIGFDSSRGAARAVDWACGFMAADNRDVMLCHVVRSLNIFLRVQKVFTHEEEKTWVDESSQAVQPTIDGAQNRLIEAGFLPGRVYQQILEDQSTRAGGIVRAAKDGAFGTIVMGRRGLTSVQDFSMGRVTRKVIHMAHKM